MWIERDLSGSEGLDDDHGAAALGTRVAEGFGAVLAPDGGFGGRFGGRFGGVKMGSKTAVAPRCSAA